MQMACIRYKVSFELKSKTTLCANDAAEGDDNHIEPNDQRWTHKLMVFQYQTIFDNLCWTQNSYFIVSFSGQGRDVRKM